MDESNKQYVIFLKYTRGYLSEVTGYSKGYLSRVATGAKEPGEVFIGVCCHNLKEPQDYLFRLIEPEAAHMPPAQPEQRNQDLLETIEDLASRLTEAETKIEALQKELRQYS